MIDEKIARKNFPDSWADFIGFDCQNRDIPALKLNLK